MTRQHPLKVLFLTSSYPRNESDTAAVFLRYLAGELAARGLQVHVLAPADGRSESKTEGKLIVHRFQYFPARWQKLAYGSGIMPNLKRSPRLWLQVPFYLLAMTLSLLRLLRVERFDVLHAHWIVPQGLIGALARKIFSVPLITTAHGGDAFALQGWFSRLIKRQVVANSDAWTTNTSATSKAIEPGASTPPHVIPMGVDIARFANGERAALRRSLPDDQFLLLFVGRLVEKKGCDDLLRALALLPPALGQRTTLWIVGDGDQKTILEKTATDLGIDRQMRFWGAVSNQNLPDFYAAADLFIAPSIEARSGDTEGQGVVILEAFAARAGVLATRIGGISSMVRDQATGLLVEPGNPRALAAAIDQLLNDLELRKRLADNAFAEVTARYSWARIAGEFEKLYREVLGSLGR